jgi:hypothetical protein
MGTIEGEVNASFIHTRTFISHWFLNKEKLKTWILHKLSNLHTTDQEVTTSVSIAV